MRERKQKYMANEEEKKNNIQFKFIALFLCLVFFFFFGQRVFVCVFCLFSSVGFCASLRWLSSRCVLFIRRHSSDLFCSNWEIIDGVVQCIIKFFLLVLFLFCVCGDDFVFSFDFLLGEAEEAFFEAG